MKSNTEIADKSLNHNQNMCYDINMIDALFGSKTRVKLLGLFMNNPERSFYVREITRNIGEQINSVRRELANLVNIGIITDKSVDNRLYYQVDTKFKYYHALREMFADEDEVVSGAKVAINDWATRFRAVRGVSVVVLAGAMVYGSTSKIDLLVAGNHMDESKVKTLIKALERDAGASLNYTIMSLDDLYYRLSIRDRFVLDVLESNHTIVLDGAGILVDYPGIDDATDMTTEEDS